MEWKTSTPMPCTSLCKGITSKKSPCKKCATSGGYCSWHTPKPAKAKPPKPPPKPPPPNAKQANQANPAPNAKPDGAEATSLLDAAKRGDFATVRRILTQHPHLVNAQPGGRWSALHQAAYHGNKDAIAYLFGLGASPALLTKDGKTPWDVLPPSVKGSPSMASLFGVVAPPPAFPSAFPPKFQTHDLQGRTVSFEARSRPSSLLGAPLYFCPHALMSPRQDDAGPVLLATRGDWGILSDPSVTHEGAFGRDYDAVGKVVPHDAHTWVSIWKFPGDLNYLPTFRRILGVPLPVGTYPLYVDKWFSMPEGAPRFSELRWNHHAATKMRADQEVGPSVHSLKGATESVAMIGHNYFIEGFWEAVPARAAQIVRMLEELLRTCRVLAFPCYGQHHAIVFYADVSTNQLLTPRRWASLLRGERGKRIMDHLRAGALSFKRADLAQWRANYCSTHG